MAVYAGRAQPSSAILPNNNRFGVSQAEINIV